MENQTTRSSTEDNEQLEAEIYRTEVDLNRALGGVLEKIEHLTALRGKVTDVSSIRRGWGLDVESKRFHDKSWNLIHAIKCHITEFGGGVTTDQQRLLEMTGLVKPY